MVKRKKNKVKVPRSLRRLFPEVEECSDSEQRVEVSVKQQDCNDGKQKRATECAMAKAAKRQFKVDGVVIGLSRSYIIKGKKAVRFKTPESVAREITSFDRHHDFAPGEYHLAPVSPTSRMGKPAGTKHSGSRNANRKVHRATARVRVLH